MHDSVLQPPETHTFTHQLNKCLGRQADTHTQRQVCSELVLTLPTTLNPSQKHAVYCRSPRSPKAERTRTQMERKHGERWYTQREWRSNENKKIENRKAPWHKEWCERYVFQKAQWNLVLLYVQFQINKNHKNHRNSLRCRIVRE